MNKPEIPQHLVEYVNAFWILNSSRSIGMSLNPIFMSEIKHYLDMFPTYDVEIFVHHIQAMDSVILELSRKSKDPDDE